MQRRKFLASIAALTAGSSAALATGATSITNKNRGAAVDVVTDENGVLALKDTSSGDIVNLTNGKLQIDFAEFGGSEGVNIGSEVVLGEISESDIGNWGYAQTPAFQIVNQAAGQTFDISFKYELDNPGSLNQDGSVLVFYNFHNTHYSPLRVSEGSGEKVSAGTFEQNDFLSNYDGLEPGQAIDMAVAIDTTNPGSSTDEDISGKLTIEATPH